MRHNERTHKAGQQLDQLIHTLPGMTDEVREEILTLAYRLADAMQKDMQDYMTESMQTFQQRMTGNMIGVGVQREEWEETHIEPFFKVQIKSQAYWHEYSHGAIREKGMPNAIPEGNVYLVRESKEHPFHYITKQGHTHMIMKDDVEKVKW